jgi:hypothetical protein
VRQLSNHPPLRFPSCAWPLDGSRLSSGGSTPGYVKLLLPPRQSRGNSHFGLVTTPEGTVSEVTSIIGGPPSVRSLLNKLHNKRSQLPSNRPAILYLSLPDIWMDNRNLGFLILNAAARQFMIRSKRMNSIVFIGERYIPSYGGCASPFVDRRVR